MFRKSMFLLFFAPLISCGCPSQTNTNPPTSTATSVDTGSDTAPSNSVPIPRPETILWKQTDDAQLIETLEKYDACFVLYFRSNKNEMNDFLDKVFLKQNVVKTVNKSFLPLLWVGSDEARENVFGIKLNEARLLVVPTNDSSYLEFDAFDGNGNPLSTVDKAADEIVKGLTTEAFSNCTEAKEKIDQ